MLAHFLLALSSIPLPHLSQIMFAHWRAFLVANLSHYDKAAVKNLCTRCTLSVAVIVITWPTEPVLCLQNLKVSQSLKVEASTPVPSPQLISYPTPSISFVEFVKHMCHPLIPEDSSIVGFHFCPQWFHRVQAEDPKTATLPSVCPFTKCNYLSSLFAWPCFLEPSNNCH